MALAGSGEVYAWGEGVNGEIGDGAKQARTLPVRVALPANTVALAAGDLHTLALTAEGSVWAWGNNTYGQVGDGSKNTTRPTPIPVPGLSDIQALAAGGFASFALGRDGTVWSWGQNIYGQLGNGSQTDNPLPTRIPSLTGVVAIAACHDYSGCGAALTADGSVYTWGNNGVGQLGDGTRTNRSTPAKILDGVSDLRVGSAWMLARKTDTTVLGWGWDHAGLLDSVDAMVTSPRPVDRLAGAEPLAVGYFHGFARGANGKLLAWGKNELGELGDGSRSPRSQPVEVALPEPVLAVDAGLWTSAAIGASGKIYAWGDNAYGEVGDGTRRGASPRPGQVAGLPPMAAVAAGDAHSLVLAESGRIYAFGTNSHGELGLGNTTMASGPQLLAGLSAKALAAGAQHSLALSPQGEVFAWGANGAGQLGDGSQTGRGTPAKVAGVPRGVVAIAAGGDHSLALSANGQVWGWGANSSGELGPSAALFLSVPTPIPGLADIVQIGCGGGFVMALSRDGSLWTLGDNTFGQLGNGGSASRSAPQAILGPQSANPEAIVHIVAGHHHGLAVGDSGVLYLWGGDSFSNSAAAKPTRIDLGGIPHALASGGGWTSIAHINNIWEGFFALTPNGLYGWGRNDSGQLGNSSFDGVGAPQPTAALPAGKAIAAGSRHTLYLAQNGAVYAWGQGDSGQLGVAVDYSLPRAVLSPEASAPLDLGPLGVGGGFSARAAVVGDLSRRSITGTLNVAAGDWGKAGNLYAAYLLPDGSLFFRTPSGWQAYQGGGIPAYTSTTLGRHEIPIFADANLTSLVGAGMYIGYGLNDADLVGQRKYELVYPVR